MTEEVKAVGFDDVKMLEAEKLVGNYAVLWRNESKQVAKIMEVDKDKQKITYELVSGPDKGKKLRSQYDSSQTIRLFREDNLSLALLDA